MTGQIDTFKDSYSDKLIKLLPAEGIAALTTIKTLIPVNGADADWLWWSAAIVGLFVLLWAWIIRLIRNPLQLAFIMIAYLLWMLNILWDLASDLPIFSNAPPAIPAVCSILFALFIPLVFPPQQG